MGGRKYVRREADLRRGGELKSPRESILVVCEGGKTEPLYFKGLWQKIRLATVDVHVVGQGAEIVGVVEAAIELLEKRKADSKISVRLAPYKEVWCVVDTELKKDSHSWKRGLDKAKAKKLNLAWSNPCFEYWLLLHFERVGGSFDGYKAIKPVLTKHIRNYEKNLNCFEQLAPRIPTAINHAEHIHRSQWKDTPNAIDQNPGTTVPDLVKGLISMAGMTLEEYQTRFPLTDTAPAKSKRTRRP